ELAEAISQRRARRMIRRVYDNVVWFLQLHSSAEEEFMSQHHYPEQLVAGHQAEHRELIREATEVGPDRKVVGTLTEALGRHAAEDQKFLGYFRIHPTT